MAHFRKLTFNDIDYESSYGEKYEYSIGKKWVSVRNKTTKFKDIVEKEIIGFAHGYGYVVTPQMIVNFMLGRPKLKIEECFPTCDCVGVKKRLDFMPHNKIYENQSLVGGTQSLVFWCEDCFS